MNKWYLVGDNLPFDMNIFFSEISVDYFNRGDYIDVLGYHHYYVGVAAKLYSEFIDLYNVEDIDVHLKEFRCKYPHVLDKTFKIKIERFKKNNTIENISSDFRSLLSTVSNALKIRDYDKMHSQIAKLFIFLANILCFERKDRCVQLNKNINYSFIANYTGGCSFNSYMFALVNNVYLLNISINCSITSLLHEVENSVNIMKTLSRSSERDKLTLVYETILKASKDRYNRQEKELLIFTLWYLIHENCQPISSSVSYPYSFSIDKNKIMMYIDVFVDIDYKVRGDMLDNIDTVYGWIDTSVDKSRFSYINNISEDARSSQSIKVYLQGLSDEDYHPEGYRDRMARLALMPIYGFYMLHKLFVELDVLDLI